MQEIRPLLKDKLCFGLLAVSRDFSCYDSLFVMFTLYCLWHLVLEYNDPIRIKYARDCYRCYSVQVQLLLYY